MPFDSFGYTRERKPYEYKANEDYGDDWPVQREKALKRDNYCCRKCGTSVKGTSKRAVHHIIERSKGGTNRTSNLITNCTKCHIAEHPHMQKWEAKKAQKQKTPYLFGGLKERPKKIKRFF